MKKGFTLIELLVTIVVIGLVAMIAFPAVGNIITSMKERSFVESRKGLIRAARLYMEANQDLLPYNAGDVSEVSISTLVSEKYIKEIKSPVDGSTCGGYILVRQNDTTSYDYYPQYRCGASSGITSRANDSLVLDYTFDDFQEPTVNLIPNPSGTTVTNSVPGNYKPGWDNSLHDDAIVVSGWSTGYNGGVPSPTIGYHGRWVYVDSNPMMFFEDRNDVYALGHRWLGISQDLGVSSSLGLTLNKPLALSWNQKSSVLSKGGQVGLYHTRISTGTSSFESNILTTVVGAANKWERTEFTSTVGSDWDLTKSLRIYAYGSTGAYGDLWMDDFQLELKPYSTPYVNGTRTGTITDYSGTGKNAPLALVSTPRWIEDSVRKSGVYQFEGTNTYIDAGLNADYHLTTGSISLWANTSRSYPSDTTSTSYRGLISKTINGGSSGTSYFIDWNGTNSTRTLRAAIGDATNVNQVTVSNFDFKNAWNHIVFTWNGTKLYLYVNGEKVGETNQTRVVQNLNKSLEIGRAFGANGYNWSGSIDQVKMYQRELLDTEIKSLYFMERVN